ncbi:hypothetical protein [Neobacillus mesonae]|uniref:hypothetical protein n=1 Tax=Neobacillus mesonae TaxID=1193713 RepID=UPI0020422238|nr:hypothetical protein [Neobacillus mesonae]MCM3567993.1 hypothetical protein [Neobacillus mesonae]
MRKILIFIFLFHFMALPLTVHAELPRLSAECLKKMNIRNEQYEQSVIKDIMKTLNLDMNNNRFLEIKEKSLEAAHLIYGGKEKDPYYHSLHKQFMVASRGRPRLFIKHGEAYVLYRKPDDTNVAVYLKLADSKWEVKNTKIKKGNHVRYKILKCESEYLKKKNEYQNVK